MSGVYIKGMEMPKTGEYRCVIRKWGEEITVDLYGDEELCGKLIPVPDHGALKDADALADLFRSKAAGEKGLGSLMVNMAALCIDNAPVVIPADKEEP